MSREVYTRDTSSGKIHLRTLVNGVLQSFEADNLDDAGEFEVVAGADIIEKADPADKCRRCFPQKPGEDVTPEDEA